jgi:hypothetical protein
MRFSAWVLVAALVLLLAPVASANSWWCSPEYQSCTDGDGDGGSGTGTSGGSGLRSGTVVYGGHYAACAAVGASGGRCWECVWNPTKRTHVCGGVYHDAYCECSETVSNYVITNCSTYGNCIYNPA